jgi:hypothetical protein
MDFPEPVGPALPSAETFSDSFHEPMIEGARDEGAPVMAHPSADVISLDSMRSAMVANFEQEDLDVPAFLRKRGEVM